MEDKQLKDLVRKRAGLRHRLTTYTSYVNNIQELYDQNNVLDEQVWHELELRTSKIEGLLQEFEVLQTEIECLTSEEMLEQQFTKRDDLERDYFSTLSIAKGILSHKPSGTAISEDGRSERSSTSVNESAIHQQPIFNNIKLPTIDLPKFNGAYDNWLEFKDTFASLIHNNNTINNVQKYHYLRASLEGPAAQLIHSLDFSATNYDIAWDLLIERFDNKHLLVNNHIKEIFSIPTLTKETSNSLRQLVDNLCKHVRALKILEQPVDSWDTLMIYIINTKLNKGAASDWEKQRSKHNFPTLNDLISFLRSRADLLETIEYREKDLTIQPTKHKVRHNALLSTHHVSCNFCKGEHLIYTCPAFLKLNVAARREKVVQAQLCFNCLKTGHSVKKCRSGGCRLCKGWHNSLLHEDKQQSFTACDTTQVLLSTASVKVKDSAGKYHFARAILDSGSQSNFISQDLCSKLYLKTQSANMTIVGFNQVESPIHTKCQLDLKSKNNSFFTNISCFIVPKISDDIPSHSINSNLWDIPNHINLADAQFMKPSKIDLLIGAGLFWKLLLPERHCLGKNKPILQNTLLGWVVSGSLSATQSKTHCKLSINVQKQLRMFWEVEEVSTKPAWTQEQIECEKHFVQTTKRQADGRFSVKIPFKESPDKLGDSEPAALKRLYSLERKFNKNPQFKESYVNFIREYETLGHMTLIPQPDEKRSESYFLPHHGVQNLDSLTTKLRVVFDGSAPTSTGYSLNEIQSVGPTIQQDLCSLLLRFRQHKYVLSADVTKMYRQVVIDKEQRHLQRIFWRFNSQDPISVYELNTITYGTASGSYLAIRCLHQCALDNLQRYPEAATIILNDFYVDDLLTGADTITELRAIYENVSKILETGCFQLRKWITNTQGIFSEIDNQTINQVLNLGEHEHTKTLGVRWASQNDSILYKISTPENTYPVTKRTILSEVATIFDPLGLLSPSIIIAKIMLQKLWLLKLEWDDEIPPQLNKQWIEFRQNLVLLNDLRIPRHIFIKNHVSVELHGFSDASQDAYGACVYARSVDTINNIQVTLICAKSKVSPLKTITIPKLELNGALMLVNLMQKLLQSLSNKSIKSYYWSDSQVVLCWIRTQPNTLLPFVSNRVAQIQELTDPSQWQYVSSSNNPADLVSRGLVPEQLLISTHWWNGPIWLSEPKESWPKETFNLMSEVPERRKKVNVLISNNKEDNLFDRFSSYTKMKRVIALCNRFVNNCRDTKGRCSGSITFQELTNAEQIIIRCAQRECFNKDINILKSGNTLNKSSKLLSFSPFIDAQGLLRVGGRLKHSPFTQDKKHPYLLNSKHRLATLIFKMEHERLLHAGPQLLLATVREKYWILSARNLAKKIVRTCVKCVRYNPVQNAPIMGDLPSHRVKPSFPFEVTGLDYAGPFILREKLGRGKKTFKAYICLFVCFSSKALHLEPVTDLSTESFLATLKRFIARRGKPTDIYSDNGRTFLGATSQLKDLGTFLTEHVDSISDTMSNLGTRWHFIPPYSPNFGGLWEAGVKSTKYHLKRVLGNAILCLEDFMTILTQIEGILNSRPISILSSDPNDLQALTPSHFLIGRSINSIAEPCISAINPGRLGRFQYIQQLKDHFWTRWSKEYLAELQFRTKWKTQHNNIKQDDIVLLRQDNSPPASWQLGRVVALHPGSDSITRVVSVQTVSGVVKRPVNKLCILPLEDSDD